MTKTSTKDLQNRGLLITGLKPKPLPETEPNKEEKKD